MKAPVRRSVHLFEEVGAAGDGLGNGCRSEERRLGIPGRAARLVAAVAGQAGVMDDLLCRPSGLRELGGDAMPADPQPPGQGEAVVVVGIFEDAKASRDDLIDTRAPVVGRTEIEVVCEPRSSGFGAQPASPPSGPPLPPRWCLIGVIEGAKLGQASPRSTRSAASSAPSSRSAEARRRRLAAADMSPRARRSPSRRPEPLRRSAAKCSAVVVKRAEVREIAVRLLEVVAQDLLELGTPLVRRLTPSTQSTNRS